MSNPAISVIVPTYNVEKYVEQCIDSLLNQTFSDIEVIIIDDCSTDGSLKLVTDKYGDIANVFICHNNINLGLGMTRNRGMKMAHGKYVYFLDSDDVLLPNGLERLYILAEQNQADVMHINEWYEPRDEFFDLRKKVPAKVMRDALFQPDLQRFPLDVEQRINKIYGTQRHAVMVWLNLYRREFLEKNSLEFPAIIHEDNAFALACYASTDRIYSISGAFYLYRQRNSSIVGGIGYDRLEREVKAIVLGMKYVGKMLSYHVSPANVRMGKIHFFNDLWGNVLPYYADGINIPAKTIETVEKTMKDVLGEDYLLASMLMHHACAYFSRLRK